MTKIVEALRELDSQYSRILHEMAGAVSLCWEPRPTGVFESTQACEFVAAAIEELRSITRAALAEHDVQPQFTTGHCKEKAKPGGCQLHNLHCGYPNCDRKPIAQPVEVWQAALAQRKP